MEQEVKKGSLPDLGGAAVIAPEQFAGDASLTDIVIPEGVAEIGERAFCGCPALESVILPQSLRKIGKMAFMECRKLKIVILQEGVEEIETNAFGGTENLGLVELPDSLQKVDRNLFGLGGGSPYAAACMSGTLAARLMEAHNRNSAWTSDAINARGFLIDGTEYETMASWFRKDPEGEEMPVEFTPDMIPDGMDADSFLRDLEILDEDQRKSLFEAMISLKSLQNELADLQAMAGEMEGKDSSGSPEAET